MSDPTSESAYGFEPLCLNELRFQPLALCDVLDRSFEADDFPAFVPLGAHIQICPGDIPVFSSELDLVTFNRRLLLEQVWQIHSAFRRKIGILSNIGD